MAFTWSLRARCHIRAANGDFLSGLIYLFIMAEKNIKRSSPTSAGGRSKRKDIKMKGATRSDDWTSSKGKLHPKGSKLIGKLNKYPAAIAKPPVSGQHFYYKGQCFFGKQPYMSFEDCQEKVRSLKLSESDLSYLCTAAAFGRQKKQFLHAHCQDNKDHPEYTKVCEKYFGQGKVTRSTIRFAV